MNTKPPESSAESGSSWKWLTRPWAVTTIILLLLIAALYVEEDWRGYAYWNQAKAEIAAQGESLDPATFIPPPVPEDENFGALPIFRMEPDSSGYPSSVGMDEAFAHADPSKIPGSKDDHLDARQFPYLGNFVKGEAPDVPVIKKRLFELCHLAFPTRPAPADASPEVLFDMLCPALRELRAANRSFPVCRFDADYVSQPAAVRPMGVIVKQISLVKVLSYDERLALISGDPERALDDLKVGWKVDSGVRKVPQLLGGLVSLGVEAIQMRTIADGLAHHNWNDQQLAEIDDNLGQIDCLSTFQLSIRGDVVVFLLSTVDYSKSHRLLLRSALFGAGSPTTLEEKGYDLLSIAGVSLIPDGWFDSFKADSVRFELLGTVKMVDPVSRRVFPERETRALHLIEDARESSVWRNFLEEESKTMLYAAKNFAYGQVQLDEARIACRLERFRLAHGSYPNALQDLVPAYGKDLPNDVMNGQPYHYKVANDGSYLLYSVGWNQLDEGGREVFSSTGYHSYKEDPDWVWTNQPEPKKSK